ncbi:unnamed protein product [Sympodiomycopsis kandeliae]
MKIAIEGCSHGELDNIYASIAKAEEAGNFKTDVLLLCGDMQSLRNRADLQCLAVPEKYRQMGDFHKYYSGEKVAPLLTLVIGGNHEASNYLFELYHGGWIAPNIYFLGEAGVVDVGGIRIAGISGIYKSHDYQCGRYERMPLGNRDIRSIYHTRIFDIWRLKLMAQDGIRPDIVMSHDWPNTIEQHGDTKWLIKNKPFFKDEINTETLGSPPLRELLDTVQPQYWFSAHLHVKFAALYKHGQPKSSAATQASNPEALDIDLDDLDGVQNSEEIAVEDDEDEDPPGACDHSVKPAEQSIPTDKTLEPDSDSRTTRFLALSKCLPNQDFLQFIDVPTTEVQDTSHPPSLRFVPRWLAILRATNHRLSLQRSQPALPSPQDEQFLARIAEEERWIQDNLISAYQPPPSGGHPLDITNIQRFIPTAAPTNSPVGSKRFVPLQWYTNPQTEALTDWLRIENKINRPEPSPGQPDSAGFPPRNSEPLMRFAGPSSYPQQQPFGSGTTDVDEIKKIELAAQHAMEARKRTKMGHMQHDVDLEEREPLRLDDDDEYNARWKEGTG